MTRQRAFVLCAVIAGLALFTSPGIAQVRPWQVALGAGPSFPVGDLADEAQTGYHVQGSVLYALARLPVDLRADLVFQNMYSVERESTIDRSLGGEWYRQLSGIVSVKYAVDAGSLHPYGLLGTAWGREWHDDRTYWTDRQTSLNFNVGAGLDFPLLGAGGFVEVRYLNLFGGEPLATRPPAVYPEVDFRTLPITVGVR